MGGAVATLCGYELMRKYAGVLRPDQVKPAFPFSLFPGCTRKCLVAVGAHAQPAPIAISAVRSPRPTAQHRQARAHCALGRSQRMKHIVQFRLNASTGQGVCFRRAARGQSRVRAGDASGGGAPHMHMSSIVAALVASTCSCLCDHINKRFVMQGGGHDKPATTAAIDLFPWLASNAGVRADRPRHLVGARAALHPCTLVRTHAPLLRIRTAQPPAQDVPGRVVKYFGFRAQPVPGTCAQHRPWVYTQGL